MNSINLTATGYNVDRSNSAQRLRSLTDTLNQTQTQNRIDFEQNQRQVETRLNQLQQKVEKSIQSDNQKFALLGDQLQKLYAAQAAEKASRELMTARKSKEIELMETQLQQAYDTENKNRTELKDRVTQQTTERIRFSITDLQRMADEDKKLHDNQFNFMKESVTRVITQIQQDRLLTDEKYKDLNTKLDQQCFDIRNQILKESQEAEQQQQTFTDTFRKVCQMLQQKLINEREDRERKEELILNMLEEVCGKVEQYGI